jgi:DNA-binding CsgD family transcriptional regulator
MVRSGIDVPMIGRERELAVIRAILTQAAAGSGRSLIVYGEAGIGKTRLLAEAEGLAKALGFMVFRGAGDDIEQARPYGVVANAFGRGGLPEASRASPGDRSDITPVVVDSIVSVIEDSRSAPVALFVDDLHWADTGTLRVLRSLVRRAASLPFAFVAATRPAPTGPQLDALIEDVRDEGTHIELDPLDDIAIATLVDRLVAESVTVELRSRVASARGNPFFVIEIVASGIDQLGATELPRDVRRTVLRRVMQLSEPTVSVLRLAALLGPHVDPADLELISGRSATEIASALEEALKSRVLEDDAGSFVFRHDIVREAIYTDMPSSIRHQLHRDAGRMLAAAGASASRVALHMGAVAEAGDVEAISWLRRAAAEEMQHSPTIAADVLERAAVLIDHLDPMHDEVLVARVQALCWSGRVVEAVTLASEVLADLSDPELAVDVRESLGEALFFSGRILEAGDQLEAAADACRGSARGLLLAQAALCRGLSGQISASDDLAERALVETASTKDPRAISMATAVRGVFRLVRGEPGWMDLCREGVRVADEDFLREANRYGSRSMLAYALREADLFDETVGVLNDWVRLSEEHGIGWARPSYHALMGGQYFDRGDWEDAVAEFETAREVLDEMGSSLLKPAWLGVLASIEVHRGDLVGAERSVVAGEALLTETGPQTGAEWLVLARILLMEARGDVGGALAVAHGACRLACDIELRLGLRYFAPAFVRLAVAAGVPEQARFAVDVLERVAPVIGTHSAVGTALLCRGMLTFDTPRLLEAVGTLAEGGRPLELAMAYEQAGLSLARDGDKEAAADHFDRAIGVFEQLGAQLDVQRVTEESRGAGGRRRRAKHRPESGWESLSPTERLVVELVAEGLTNPAIAESLVVSRRTVETHVSHLFRKLGVTSRVELVLRATRELSAEVQ